ncbi:Calmodulin binding protein, central domain [Dillenia turbinata]|uniref:Calmodulin binding protein, central domain n=1 Tax=Dillenia turbinata TaxID=194707 RepID=A0AAN8WED6_9MAGN
MEASKGRRLEKRGYEDDDDGLTTQFKKPKLPALASVVVEALKVDCLQRLCSSLEPLFRRIVSEEVERALTRLGHGHAKLAGRSSPPRLQGPEGRRLRLHFKSRMPPHLFTGGKVEGEQGAPIHVVLLDMSTSSVVHKGPESAAKLSVVVLEGDFNDESDDDWTKEDFECHEVKEREGKRPLLTGDLQVALKEGVGTLGDLTFTDNSSWIRSRKFRLGLKVSPGCCDEIRVREAKTEAFAVKDHRGELYKKHYPPALHDEVWRLDRIAKDGALHKKLVAAGITTVEDFLRVLVRDQQKLRNILGSAMSNRMWENTVEHAKTCIVGGKLYVYYPDENHGTGVVFNDIYELRGLISNGQFISLDSLTDNQKVSVDSLVKRAYENWDRVIEYDGKVLSSLSCDKVTTAHDAHVPDNNLAEDLYYATDHRQQYVSTDHRQYQIESSNLSIPRLIELPLLTPDQTNSMALTVPQGALRGAGIDYPSMGTSELGGGYFGGDWNQPRNGLGVENLFAEEVRLRSSEMLASDDMQRLLKTFGVGMGYGFVHDDYSHNVPYDPQMDRFGQKRGRSSGRAVVGWLKLKAALRDEGKPQIASNHQTLAHKRLSYEGCDIKTEQQLQQW